MRVTVRRGDEVVYGFSDSKPAGAVAEHEGGRNTGTAIGYMTADSSGALPRVPPVPLDYSWCHGGAPETLELPTPHAAPRDGARLR